MSISKRIRLGVVATAGCLFFTAPVCAEPLATAGIGVASCEKLAKDLNPEEGFKNATNALVFYWVQGYMSAANITCWRATRSMSI